MENLTRAVEGLDKELTDLRRAFEKRTKTFRTALRAGIAIGCLLSVALVVAAFLAIRVQADNERRIRESEQRLCPVLTVALPHPGDRRSDDPALRKRQDDYWARIRKLADQYHCPTG